MARIEGFPGQVVAADDEDCRLRLHFHNCGHRPPAELPVSDPAPSPPCHPYGPSEGAAAPRPKGEVIAYDQEHDTVKRRGVTVLIWRYAVGSLQEVDHHMGNEDR